MVAPRVVVVEDEDDVRDLIAFNLRAAHLDVVTVDSLGAELAQVEREAPDILVFDRMLPDGDGLVLCGRMRAEPRFVDVARFVLSALGSERDRVVGLELGADDYVVKPFSVRELVARVRLLGALAVDRRGARANGRKGEQLRWRNLVVDVDSQRALSGGREIALRPLEFKLLQALFAARGRRLSRSELLGPRAGVRGVTSCIARRACRRAAATRRAWPSRGSWTSRRRTWTRWWRSCRRWASASCGDLRLCSSTKLRVLAGWPGPRAARSAESSTAFSDSKSTAAPTRRPARSFVTR